MSVDATRPAIWSARITHNLSSFSAFMPNATRQWEGDAAMGNVIKIPTIDQAVTVGDYNRAGDLAAPEVIASTTQDLTIDQEKFFNFMLEDLDGVQNKIGASTLIESKALAASLALSTGVDAYVGGLLNALQSNKLLADIPKADFDLNFSSAVRLKATLANLSMGGLVCVTTPEVINKIDIGMIAKTYGDVVTAGNFAGGILGDPQAGQNGYVGVINGLRFYVSNNIGMRRKADGTAPAVNSRGTNSVCYVYDPRDLGLVVQVNKVETYRLEKRFATGVKGLVNYGGKVINGLRIQRFNFND